MNSRTLSDKLSELRSLNLANRLVFDYRPPADIKENNEPVTQEEAEDRFYKDYIKPEDEAKMIVQQQLPAWDENLKSLFLTHWSSDKRDELFGKNDYLKPQQFLSKINVCLNKLIVTNKYLIDEIKRDRKLSPEGLAQDFFNEALEVIKYCDFFKSILTH